MGTIKKILWTLAALLIGLSQPSRAEIFPPGEFVFLWEDELGYLISNEAPLIDILGEISLLTGIEIEGIVSEAALVTADLRMKSLESIINSIAASSVITYGRCGETGEFVMESVTITLVGDPEQVSRNARQRVIDQHNLAQQLQTRQTRPVRYVGIGANVAMNEDRTGVWLSPMSDDSPAYKGGVRMGDLAVAVDGRPVESFRHMGEIIASIRGREEGSSVTFTIRNPDGTQTVKTIQREQYRFDPRSQR